MILTAHQPQFFGGYAGYISKIDEADIYIYMDDVDYSKNDFINRNRIRTKDSWQWLAVPILYQGHAKIKDILIDNTKNWRKKHIKTIEQNYSKAPYFDKYIESIKSIYWFNWSSLSDFNYYCLAVVLAELGIDTRIAKMSNHDFRGEKSDLILDMCLTLKCDKFIFGANAIDYIQPKLFSDAGIQIELQNYQQIEYKQVYNKWEPFMSVLDLLFCKGPGSLGVIRGNTS